MEQRNEKNSGTTWKALFSTLGKLRLPWLWVLAALSPGHLGLGTMRERAATIGAALDLDAAPGAGTRVTVQLRSPSVAF